ncbi:MAG: hypothetical protein ABI876_08745 [Bacteroidota bacterium]
MKYQSLLFRSHIEQAFIHQQQAFSTTSNPFIPMNDDAESEYAPNAEATPGAEEMPENPPMSENAPGAEDGAENVSENAPGAEDGAEDAPGAEEAPENPPTGY